MGFVKAKFKVVGERREIEGEAIVDTGAWYTVIDEELADYLGVEYTGLTLLLTPFSGQRIECREAIVKSLSIEGRTAPFELISVCSIPDQVKKLLRRQEAEDRIVIGTHSLERLGYAVDVAAHRLVESPGVLMLLIQRGE